MKTKLEMAHEIAVAMQSQEPITDMKILSALAWQYADAMQAEADKRTTEVIVSYASKEFHNKLEVLCKKEWQPDWSQAPDGFDYWVATSDRDGKITGGWFYDVEPDFGEGKGVSIYYSPNGNCVLTESFGYVGDWRGSLRKRPN